MREENVDGKIVEHWTPEEVLQGLRDRRIVLIDVRTPQEYMFEHIEGSLLAPMAFIDPRSLPQGESKKIVFHCGSGMRSRNVAGMCLREGEVRVAHMEGGFGAWKAAKLPYIGTEMSTGAPKRVD